MSPIPRHATPMLWENYYCIMCSTHKNKSIFESCHRCPFSFTSKAIYLSAIADSGKTHLSHGEFEEFANSKIQKQEISGLWLCTLCGQTSGNSTHLKRHIEARHVILPPLICYICQKPSKTSHSMRMHMKYQHNVVGSVF